MFSFLGGKERKKERKILLACGKNAIGLVGGEVHWIPCTLVSVIYCIFGAPVFAVLN